MPFRAESSSFRAYSARKPFPFHVCTMDADGSGNKRLTEKSEEKDKTAYRLVQIGPNSICCFFIIWKCCFLETQIKRQAVNCAPSRKINFYFLRLWLLFSSVRQESSHLEYCYARVKRWFFPLICFFSIFHYCKWHQVAHLQVSYLWF